LRRGGGGAYKTGLVHEIELLEEMRAHVSLTISKLSSSARASPEELVRLKTQGARLLNCLEKALLKRQIALLLDDLDRRRPILRDFYQKYEALIGLRTMSPLNVAASPEIQAPHAAVATSTSNVSTEDFLAELHRVREQIFRALGELNESGEGG